MKEGFRVMGNILKVWVTEVYVFVKTQHIYHAPLYVNITSKEKKWILVTDIDIWNLL